MARYTAGGTAAGAGVALRPVIAVLSAAAVTAIIREVGIFNTTAVACAYKLVRITGGTAGGDLVEAKDRERAPAAECIAKGLWTADATIDEDLGFRLQIGASIGSGGIFTLPAGLETYVGATKGIGLVPIGTGQVCEVYMSWDE